MTLSGKVSQLQHPPSALFVPVKAAVTPPAGQNRPLPGKGVEAANVVASFQATPVKAAKGTENHTILYRQAPAKRSHHTNATCRNIVGHNMLRVFGHRVAMCCDMLGVVGSSLKMVIFESTTPNTSQHVATGWPNARNILRPTMLRYVALACCVRLAGASRVIEVFDLKIT